MCVRLCDLRDRQLGRSLSLQFCSLAADHPWPSPLTGECKRFRSVCSIFRLFLRLEKTCVYVCVCVLVRECVAEPEAWYCPSGQSGLSCGTGYPLLRRWRQCSPRGCSSTQYNFMERPFSPILSHCSRCCSRSIIVGVSAEFCRTQKHFLWKNREYGKLFEMTLNWLLKASLNKDRIWDDFHVDGEANVGQTDRQSRI